MLLFIQLSIDFIRCRSSLSAPPFLLPLAIYFVRICIVHNIAIDNYIIQSLVIFIAILYTVACDMLQVWTFATIVLWTMEIEICLL